MVGHVCDSRADRSLRVWDPYPSWLEQVDNAELPGVWRVRPEIRDRIDQLAVLATDLLPDFIDGSIQAEFHVPTGGEVHPSVSLWYEERGGGERHSLEEFGRGASRWMAIAVQVALRVMAEDPQIRALGVTGAEGVLRAGVVCGRTRSPPASLGCRQRRALVPAHG